MRGCLRLKGAERDGERLLVTKRFLLVGEKCSKIRIWWSLHNPVNYYKKKKFEFYTLKESCSQICEFYLNEAVGGKKQTNKPKQQPSFIYHSTFQGLKPSYYLCVYLLTRTHSLKTVPVLLKPASPVLTLYVAQRRCSGNINSTNEQIGQRENTPWKALLLWLMSEIYRKYLKMVDN